jgi:hypothetical protein
LFGGLALTVPLQALPSEAWLKMAQASVLAWVFSYQVIAIKRVFGGTTTRALFRGLAVSLVYLGVLISAGIAVILVLWWRAGAL